MLLPLRRLSILGLFVALLALLAVACGGDDDDDTAGDATNTTAATTTGASGTAAASGSITVYSGRSESLVQPLIEKFQDDTGIKVSVKYGGSSELAALLLEEGGKSPADVFFSQDAGALGAVSDAGLLSDLDETVLKKVDDKYRADNGQWVGVSGRPRVIAYNPDLVPEADLPASVKDLTDAKWKGKVGWVPTNASFQAFVTAFRELEGEDAAEQWLEDMKTNGVKDYAGNREVVSAVASGEISLGITNHYYLWGFIKDQGEGFKARNHYTEANDIGSLVNVAGAAILKTTRNEAAAKAFVEYLLTEDAQKYFAEQTFEYPLIDGVSPDARITPLDQLDPPDLDLSKLDDLKGTLELLQSTGVLP